MLGWLFLPFFSPRQALNKWVCVLSFLGEIEWLIAALNIMFSPKCSVLEILVCEAICFPCFLVLFWLHNYFSFPGGCLLKEEGRELSVFWRNCYFFAKCVDWHIGSPVGCPAWRFCCRQRFVPYCSPSWILQGLSRGWATLDEQILQIASCRGRETQYWGFIIFPWVVNITHQLEETELFIYISHPKHAAHKCVQACM